MDTTEIPGNGGGSNPGLELSGLSQRNGQRSTTINRFTQRVSILAKIEVQGRPGVTKFKRPLTLSRIFILLALPPGLFSAQMRFY
jgi:hypothetical protein